MIPTDIVRRTPFSDLPLAEREAIYQSVDREFGIADSEPLTKADRATIAAARAGRKSGRAKAAAPTKTVSVRLEAKLLTAADRYAKAHGLNRTELVAAGLRMVMASRAG